MYKKLTGKALAEFEAKRDMWQDVLEGVRKITTGGGKRTTIEVKSDIIRLRFTTAPRIYLSAK